MSAKLAHRGGAVDSHEYGEALLFEHLRDCLQKRRLVLYQKDAVECLDSFCFSGKVKHA